MAALLAFFFCLVGSITVGLFFARLWWLPQLISVHGAAIDAELIVTLAVAGIAFFLAQVTLGYFVWRFRARDNAQTTLPPQSRRTVVVWSALAGILITAWILGEITLGVRGLRVWANYFQAAVPANALIIEVTGQQFT